MPESTPPHVAKYKERNELLTLKLMKKVYEAEHFQIYKLHRKRFLLTLLKDSQKQNMKSSRYNSRVSTVSR